MNYITKIPAFLVSRLILDYGLFVSRDKRDRGLSPLSFLEPAPSGLQVETYNPSERFRLSKNTADIDVGLNMHAVSGSSLLIIHMRDIGHSSRPDLIPWVGPGGVFLPAVVYNPARGLVGAVVSGVCLVCFAVGVAVLRV